MSLTVTGPYHAENPRFSGEHHQVTVKGQHVVFTRGFRTLEAADQYAAAARAADSMAQLHAVTTPKQGELVTPTILVQA